MSKITYTYLFSWPPRAIQTTDRSISPKTSEGKQQSQNWYDQWGPTSALWDLREIFPHPTEKTMCTLYSKFSTYAQFILLWFSKQFRKVDSFIHPLQPQRTQMPTEHAVTVKRFATPDTAIPRTLAIFPFLHITLSLLIHWHPSPLGMRAWKPRTKKPSASSLKDSSKTHNGVSSIHKFTTKIHFQPLPHPAVLSNSFSSFLDFILI